jgi:hypothetical protein
MQRRELIELAYGRLTRCRAVPAISANDSSRFSCSDVTWRGRGRETNKTPTASVPVRMGTQALPQLPGTCSHAMAQAAGPFSNSTETCVCPLAKTVPAMPSPGRIGASPNS